MILLCSPLLSENVKNIFHSLDCETLCVPPCNSLAVPVKFHPDMLFAALGDKCLLTDRGYAEDNAEFFSRLGGFVDIKVSEKRLAPEYPMDILFDAVTNGDILLGRLEYTAPELLGKYRVKINVKQGYARCSTVMLSTAAISADKGICDKIFDCGLDVLEISKGGIMLPGYGYGFIGGASVVLEHIKTVVFFGDISTHKDGKKITAFCEEHGYKVLYPNGEPICDHGSVQVVF